MINLRKQDPIADAVKDILQQEALKGNQTKIDKNHNGKIDGQDFKILRGEKKTVKEEETVDEGVKEVAKKAFKALTGGSDKDQLDALKKRMYKPEPAKKPSDKAMGEEVEPVQEVAPPGFEGTVKAMKKHKDIDNPWALAWSMKNKGYKSHKKADGSAKNEEVEVPTQKTLRWFKENAFDYKSPRKPEPNGGSGVKQGSRYGGSKQKDVPEKDTDEKK